jgi:dihydrofolate synthase/folylpolyglutamate synthase
MEIGLGGEWDAVNIGQARIAILTTLGLDHEEYLGNTLESIAITKSKIVNDKTIVITGWPKEYHKFIPPSWNFNYGKDINDWIRYVLKVLKLDCPVSIIPIPGRYEIAENFTLDTAHNTQAIKFLMNKNGDYQKILIGILKDKDIANIICSFPKDCEILVCNLETERGVSSSKLSEICLKHGYQSTEFAGVCDAMEYAARHKTLVTGSFYTVSAAREFLKLEGYDEL